MAVTLKARAGRPLKARVRYWQPGKAALVDTTNYTVRVQVRASQRPGRVLLNAKEWIPETLNQPVPAGTVLARVGPGDWRLILNRTITRSLPPTARFEIELQNNLDPDDSVPLVTGVILTEPEVVSNA